MSVLAQMRDVVVAALQRMQAAGELAPDADLSAVKVEAPADPAHGEVATNAALVLARPAGQSPRVLAEALAVALREDTCVSAASVAGPGFVNLHLAASVWEAALRRLLQDGPLPRRATEASAHVDCHAGPLPVMDLGGLRALALADAVARLWQAVGLTVTRSGATMGTASPAPDAATQITALRGAAEAGTTRIVGVYAGDAGVDAKPLQAALRAAGGPTLEVIRSQPVQLCDGDTPLSDVAAAEAALGPDVLRFALLDRRPETRPRLDAARLLAPQAENAAFIVHYAYVQARAASADAETAALAEVDLAALAEGGAAPVLRLLAAWPDRLSEAAENAAPARIAAYLADLARAYHGLRQPGRGTTTARALAEPPGDPAAEPAKIALSRAVAIVIAAGLGILGVNPAQRLH